MLWRVKSIVLADISKSFVSSVIICDKCRRKLTGCKQKLSACLLSQNPINLNSQRELRLSLVNDVLTVFIYTGIA